MDLKTRYKIKGIGKEQVIESKVQIFTEGVDAEGRITEVQDRWNNGIPEGTFAKVSFFNLINPLWWVHFWCALVWWCWGRIWWSWPWEVGDRDLCCIPPRVLKRGWRMGKD